jgi:biotin carboxyl carrier protein
MTFEVEVAGRVRTVSVERTDGDGRLRVSVDGRAHVLDVARTGRFGLSILEVPAAIGGEPAADAPQKGTPSSSGSGRASADLQVTPGAVPGEMLVTLGGRMVAVSVNGRRKRRSSEAAGHGPGEIAITAPMPGRIVRVLVAPGDEVAARQPLVVVEAMKMENALRAPRAGRVKEVTAAAGAPVEAGRILAVIE